MASSSSRIEGEVDERRRPVESLLGTGVVVKYYCWSCYAANDRPRGTCSSCHGEIAAPAGTSYVELLIWELHHPLPDRQLIAAETLGKLRESRARETLQALASGSHDPYVAATALQSLLAIDGANACRHFLEELADKGSVPVKAVARAALREIG
jgi:hypothetical protein